MEISLDTVHLGILEDIYTRMCNSQPTSADEGTVFHQVKLGACREAAVVSAGHVGVTAKLVTNVIMENQDSSSSESKGGTTTKGWTHLVRVAVNTKRNPLPSING